MASVDLVASISSTGYIGTYYPGDTISITYIVENAWDALQFSGVSSIGFYLSINSTISTSDYLLGSLATPSLAPSGYTSGTYTATITLPAGWGAGSYYIGAVVDPFNQVVESLTNGEANNVALGLSTIYIGTTPTLPDLDARNDSGFEATLSANSVAAGTSVTLTYRMSSWGPGNAPASTTGIYRSTDSVFDAGDTLLTTNSISALNALVGSTETATLSTGGWSSGTYYIFAVADYAHAIIEANESNNPSNGVALTITGQVLPDLDVLYLPTLSASSVAQGASVTLNYYVDNVGTGSAGGSTAGIYLSTDSTITTADTLLAVEFRRRHRGWRFLDDSAHHFNQRHRGRHLLSGRDCRLQ